MTTGTAVAFERVVITGRGGAGSVRTNGRLRPSLGTQNLTSCVVGGCQTPPKWTWTSLGTAPAFIAVVALSSVEYVPRDPGGSTLHQIVRDHFAPSFLHQKVASVATTMVFAPSTSQGDDRTRIGAD